MMKRLFLILFLLLIVGFAVLLVAKSRGKSGPPSEQVVSRFQRPVLSANGYLDFPAMVNELRQGETTPKENAAIDFVSAMGPEGGETHFYLTWFEMTKDQPIPSGPFFKDLDEVVYEQLDLDVYECWSEADHPELSAWIRENEESLARFVQGAQKSAFYYPLINPDLDGDVLIGALIPIATRIRQVARCLRYRAFNHLENDRTRECMDDLLAIRRAGKLISQNGCLVELLVGKAMESIALVSELAMLRSGKLSKGDIAYYLEGLSNLPKGSKVADGVRMEKLVACDALQTLHEGKSLKELVGETARSNLNFRGFELDAAMLPLIAEFEKLEELLALNSFDDRNTGLLKAEERWYEMEQETQTNLGVLSRVFGSRKAKGERIGKLVTSMMMPAVESVHKLMQVRDARLKMIKLVFQLESHRQEFGEFPQALDGLEAAGVTIDRVDPITGDAFEYETTKDGFVLSSKGVAEHGNTNEFGAEVGVIRFPIEALEE